MVSGSRGMVNKAAHSEPMDMTEQVTEAILRKVAKCDVRAIVQHLVDQGAINPTFARRYLIKQEFRRLMSSTKRGARDIQLELASRFGLSFSVVHEVTTGGRRQRKARNTGKTGH